MPTSISTLASFLLTVRGTQGVTFCGFIAESDAAAKEQPNPDRITPASPSSESETAFLD
ncbi:hypothetical protein [Xenorhabdus sp. BG5]|uniref:hypothetical protein n=1 Tax=Xenorhabdus sp. BG5 TaxID=2782014 RepID=UPI001881B38D|nr:hypothetical protein [Xenorhabdus sp. BG5]MBE8598270.1 hypothetical protein [Xenorhabdus sp. BG5]